MLSYLSFVLVFVVAPATGLALLVATGDRSRTDRQLIVGTVLIGTLALLYTTPWDNLLIGAGAWRYDRARTLGAVWHAPIEEYAFILAQTALVGLWTVHRLRPDFPVVRQSRRDAVIGATGGLTIGVIGLGLLSGPTYYLGAILAWTGPVLALQWAVGWQYLLARWRRHAVTVALPAVYLSLVDRLAIADGLWTISAWATTGVTVGGLPVEEGLFFLVTTLFIVQGLVLLPWVVSQWGWSR